MKTLQLIHFQAVRGKRVLVDDVLAIGTGEVNKARSEMTRRAQACCGGFGEHREDKVLQLENRGTAFRH